MALLILIENLLLVGKHAVLSVILSWPDTWAGFWDIDLINPMFYYLEAA